MLSEMDARGAVNIVPFFPDTRLPAAGFADELTSALELVLRDLPAEIRREQIHAYLAESHDRPESLAGLFAAYRGSELIGAVLARTIPGRTAFLWPPRLIANAPEATADSLVRHALEWCRRAECAMAQSLPALENDRDHQRLRRLGFDRMAELLYLMCGEKLLPQTAPEGTVSFEPYSTDNHQRLKEVVAMTYQGSLDCPELDGLRDVDDVLAGYRATGVFDPTRWFIVRENDADVGCLLLTDDSQHSFFELVYMGVAPVARGRKLGLQIVRFAQWLTRRAGRARIVVAVDSQNEPAISVYGQAGFTIWDRRPVFISLIGQPTPEPSSE